jgi:hypothetical protein
MTQGVTFANRTFTIAHQTLTLLANQITTVVLYFHNLRPVFGDQDIIISEQLQAVGVLYPFMQFNRLRHCLDILLFFAKRGFPY